MDTHIRHQRQVNLLKSYVSDPSSFLFTPIMRKSECLGRAAAAAVDTGRGNPGSDPALGSEIMAIQVVIRLSALKLWQSR